MFHFPAILTILGYTHVTHRYVTRHILIFKKNVANYKILSGHTIFFVFFFLQLFLHHVVFRALRSYKIKFPNLLWK